MDRQKIRVDCPAAQAGVAAALRRAFEARRHDDDRARQFDDLLNRLS